MEYGAVDEVRRRHSLHEVRIRVAGGLPQVAGVAAATQEDGSIWRLALDDRAEPAGVLAALVGAGAVVDRFEPLLTPMEDIFLTVVREEQA
jgi:hypothetical protein